MDFSNGLINRTLEKTRRFKSLFNLKEKKHLRITRGLTGDCSCDADCIGEIMGNVKLQIHGHSNPRNDLEPARYLDENLPEKTSDTLRHHNWFPSMMKSEERAQKFHNDDVFTIQI